MIEKKFNVGLIVMAVLSFVLSVIIAFPVEGVVLGFITMAISLKKRAQYRVLIPCIISIAGVALGLAFLAFLIWTNIDSGMATSDYWFIKLLFGSGK